MKEIEFSIDKNIFGKCRLIMKYVGEEKDISAVPEYINNNLIYSAQLSSKLQINMIIISNVNSIKKKFLMSNVSDEIFIHKKLIPDILRRGGADRKNNKSNQFIEPNLIIGLVAIVVIFLILT